MEVPGALTATDVTELPGAESLLGDEAAKSIFLSPNATTPGKRMPSFEHCLTSKQELSTGHDWDAPTGLITYLENLKLSWDRVVAVVMVDEGWQPLRSLLFQYRQEAVKQCWGTEKSSLTTGPNRDLSPGFPGQSLLLFLLCNFHTRGTHPQRSLTWNICQRGAVLSHT